MAKFPKIDDETKASIIEGCEKLGEKVTAGYKKVEDKFTEAFLKEDGTLDTGKVGDAVSGAIHKVEDGIKDSYQKFNENFVTEDGKLDTDKVGSAVNTTYQKAGRSLAAGLTKLADKLTHKFGVKNDTVLDTELVTEDDFVPDEPETVEAQSSQETPANESAEEVTTEEPAQEPETVADEK